MENDLVKKQSSRKTNRPIVLASIILPCLWGPLKEPLFLQQCLLLLGSWGIFLYIAGYFSSYLLMNTVTVLIYGKLADLFGRKPVITFGIIIFLIGSILCGLAESMVDLIIFRFIQGFGAGAITPIATTIVGDIYTKEERAKIQGYLSSVWGISAILGPALGGLLVQYVSWRFIFWINIPLGILAMVGIGIFLHENIEKNKKPIDYKGAFLVTIFTSIFMYVLLKVEIDGIGYPFKFLVSWQ